MGLVRRDHHLVKMPSIFRFYFSQSTSIIILDDTFIQLLLTIWMIKDAALQNNVDL